MDTEGVAPIDDIDDSSSEEDDEDTSEESEEEDEDDVIIRRVEKIEQRENEFDVALRNLEKEDEVGGVEGENGVSDKYQNLKQLYRKLLTTYKNAHLENREYGNMYDKINKENDELVEEIENLKDQTQSLELKHNNEILETYKKLLTEKSGTIENLLWKKHLEATPPRNNKDLLHYKQNQEIIIMNQRLREEINRLDATCREDMQKMRSKLEISNLQNESLRKEVDEAKGLLTLLDSGGNSGINDNVEDGANSSEQQEEALYMQKQELDTLHQNALLAIEEKWEKRLEEKEANMEKQMEERMKRLREIVNSQRVPKPEYARLKDKYVLLLKHSRSLKNSILANRKRVGEVETSLRAKDKHISARIKNFLS